MKKLPERLAVSAMLLTLSLGLAACGSAGGTGADAGAADNARPDIIIGTANGSLCLAPLHVAIDNGYFEEEFKNAGVTWAVEEIDMGKCHDTPDRQRSGDNIYGRHAYRLYQGIYKA